MKTCGNQWIAGSIRRMGGYPISWQAMLAAVLGFVLAGTGCMQGAGDGRAGDITGMGKPSGPLEPEPILFYVGSSDGSLEYPVYLVELDAERKRFAVKDSFGGAKGPSYLVFSPDNSNLYAIDKTVSDPASGYMSVASFRVNPEDHGLEFLNRVSSEGIGPCHVHCSREGSHLFTANYTSGNIALFPIGERGAVHPAACVVQSTGRGPVKGRQEGPHTHYVTLDPGEHYLLSPDLGSDKVLVYRFDRQTGTLVPNPEQEFLELPPGSGPRHLVFHPSGQFVYVVNELNATVTACNYDETTGVLKILNIVPTVTDSHTGPAYPAAIRIHPGGRYLYTSTRGDASSIAVFSIEPGGAINRIQVVENVPGWPRDFNLDPSGNYLVAAGERSDEIELYRIDLATGLLQPTGVRAGIPSPGCILFIN